MAVLEIYPVSNVRFLPVEGRIGRLKVLETASFPGKASPCGEINWTGINMSVPVGNITICKPRSLWHNLALVRVAFPGGLHCSRNALGWCRVATLFPKSVFFSLKESRKIGHFICLEFAFVFLL